MTTLAGRTLLMSGGSRGIGLAIATRAAQDGANIVLLAKTAQPHSRLEGTVHTAAAQIDAAGGRALAIVGDVRNDDDGHVLTLSPPLDLRPKWAGAYLAYTMAKYGMSLVTLGLAEELRDAGIAANSLWPRTTIATAAVANLLGGDEALAGSRTPAIMADAAHAVLVRDPRTCTGHFFLDEEVLAQEGVTDLDRYRAVPGGGPLETDLFLDPLENSA